MMRKVCETRQDAQPYDETASGCQLVFIAGRAVKQAPALSRVETNVERRRQSDTTQRDRYNDLATWQWTANSK